MANRKTCPKCGGSGALVSNGDFTDCPHCDGLGHVAKKSHEQLSDGQRKTLGGAGGAAAGFAAGGPLGAVVGGVLGLALASDERDEVVTGNR